MNIQIRLVAVLSFAVPSWASAQLPSVHPVVTLSYHHYSNAGAPEWVFVGPARPPALHRELQAARPNGCTVTGQAQVFIGAEGRERRRFTFVGTQIVEGIAHRRARLGIATTNGIEWHDAFAVPANVASIDMGREVVALDGRIHGFSVEPITSTERADTGRFPSGCGQGAIPLAAERDGSLHCFANARVTSTWDARSAAGVARLASYRTSFRSDAGRSPHEVVGRFIRLLTGRAGRILIVHDGHTLGAHAVR